MRKSLAKGIILSFYKFSPWKLATYYYNALNLASGLWFYQRFNCLAYFWQGVLMNTSKKKTAVKIGLCMIWYIFVYKDNLYTYVYNDNPFCIQR